MHHPLRGRDVTRLEAFSDGVFAFSATLLVVSLEVPRTFTDLVTELKGFGAFGLGFMALLLIWTVHNAFFRRYGLRDRVTVFLNGCLLFVVLYYVYPLKYVSEGIAQMVFGMPGSAQGLQSADDLSLLFMLYSLGFVAIFLCVALLYAHAYRQRDALDLTAFERFEARFLCRNYLILVGTGLLSIGLAYFQIGLQIALPGIIYGLLGPFCYFHGRISSRRQPQEAATA